MKKWIDPYKWVFLLVDRGYAGIFRNIEVMLMLSIIEGARVIFSLQCSLTEILSYHDVARSYVFTKITSFDATICKS